MKVSILCSSANHPINAWLEKWISANSDHHEISLFRKKDELIRGDVLFLISCHEIIKESDKSKFTHTLVIHASDLPKGKGWSPHVWEIINGRTEITVTLLEAADKLDSGDIWKKISASIPKHCLNDEINSLLFDTELLLMDYALENHKDIKPLVQDVSTESTYHRLRTPQDSQIDPEKSIAEQFDNLRVCDPERFPAFFILHGHKYIIKLEKVEYENPINK
ncbi:MAG: formyltransferase family protein [Thiolinea sp.]